ncbi:hypothetical protein [Paenibacillus sp. S150]|uniref:hypothetical protein n=1 Tax=Paenibacillus sp. S150 TaxID=2749826 RepID=UPI001C5785BC|nr:hypothetical protein [Paenibacillus sp. S150]MBW4083537.1 hypothetical protein [Paenibacillus sp. S150]
MANIQTTLKIELDPRVPVPEILAVIRAVTPFHLGQEELILIGVMEAIEKRLMSLKGVEKHAEPIPEPGRKPADTGELQPDK